MGIDYQKTRKWLSRTFPLFGRIDFLNERLLMLMKAKPEPLRPQRIEVQILTEQIAETRKRIDIQERRLKDIQDEIYSVLVNLSNETEFDVLESRYIFGNTYANTARELNLSLRWTERICARGIEHIAITQFIIAHTQS